MVYVMSKMLRRIARTTLPAVDPPGHRAEDGKQTWRWSTAQQTVLQYFIGGDQALYLPSCVEAIKQAREVPAPYACWRLFLDHRGLLRINGRLAASRTVDPEARNPILLTRQMPMATEILRLTHEDLRHVGGTNTLLTAARTHYWILQGTRLAKAVLKNCAQCQARNARPSAQNTAPLHYTRENAPQGRVFFSIGIDMFGPMEVTQGRGRPRGKRYGLIFTCGFSRAINVEVMREATADSCFMAFKRHAAVYGQPEYINSDQGTNLLHMRKVLIELHTAWEDAQPLLRQHFPHIKWMVNPPYSPSFGGHYESLIKVLKHTFKHIAKWPRYSFTDEQLNTGLKEAAAIANMRPLTELSSDPNDPPPLRPSDFLNHRILGLPPDWRESTVHRKIKTDLDELHHELWERMKREVICNLQKPRDWGNSELIETGDLVLYKDDEWRPDFWPIARVLETYPNADGEARTVKIRYTGTGSQVKEAVHSTRNLYRLSLPPPTATERLLPSSGNH